MQQIQRRIQQQNEQVQNIFKLNKEEFDELSYAYFKALDLNNDGYISMTLVRLASFEEFINSKCFFHFEGLTKKIGNFRVALIPLIAPNV